MDPTTNDAPHRLRERFQVESRLGRGGSGDVYKAFDTMLERTVAVKVLRRENTDQQAGKRLLREARACARLAHPNIVTIHDVLQLDTGICIVMEHLDGSSLDSTDGGRNARTLEERIGIVARILDGLEYAHRRGVVHRDVKPRNVQLLPDGSIKVLDFGVAHIAGVETLTVTGTITGTVHYASPEQLRGEGTDARTDIYSAGILAYELLTGRRPFDGDSMGAVVTKVLHEPLPEMGGDWGRRLPEVERIIRTATAKDREDRYASAEAMRNALDGVVAGMVGRNRQSELGPPPESAQADTSDTEETSELETGTSTAATAAKMPKPGAEPGQAPDGARRWRPETIAATAIMAAVIGVVLWTERVAGRPGGQKHSRRRRPPGLKTCCSPPQPAPEPQDRAPDPVAQPATNRTRAAAEPRGENTAEAATPPRADTAGAGTPARRRSRGRTERQRQGPVLQSGSSFRTRTGGRRRNQCRHPLPRAAPRDRPARPWKWIRRRRSGRATASGSLSSPTSTASCTWSSEAPADSGRCSCRTRRSTTGRTRSRSSRT